MTRPDFLLTRRRFVYLSAVALTTTAALGGPVAWAAEASWLQNHQETDLWSKADGGKALERAPQWSYFRQLGGQQGARIPVEHPLTKQKVYVEALVVGASGPPPAGWAYGGGQQAAPAAPATPAPAPGTAPPPAAPATPPAAASPTPVQGAAQGSWVSTFLPGQLWTAPEGGLSVGQISVGSFFQVMEPQRGPRLRVRDPLTGGLAFVEAGTAGPAAGPPATPRVPDRWWGYVAGEGVNVRSAPSGGGERLGALPKGTPVGVEAWVAGQEVYNDQPTWARLGEGTYVYSPLLRKAPIDMPPPAPAHGPLGARWIDVNLAQQTVTAYEADRPVYMTFTSSGRPSWETTEGIHKILWRSERETMESSSLLGRDAARADYRVENVRWTQYFTRDGQAIHENYWRNPALFGIPSSHGCLGMAAQDALWFWLWASPGVPLSVHY